MEKVFSRGKEFDTIGQENFVYNIQCTKETNSADVERKIKVQKISMEVEKNALFF